MRVKIVTVRAYRFRNFAWDMFMTFATGGLWLVWIFVREMRRHG